MRVHGEGGPAPRRPGPSRPRPVLCPTPGTCPLQASSRPGGRPPRVARPGFSLRRPERARALVGPRPQAPRRRADARRAQADHRGRVSAVAKRAGVTWSNPPVGALGAERARPPGSVRGRGARGAGRRRDTTRRGAGAINSARSFRVTAGAPRPVPREGLMGRGTT